MSSLALLFGPFDIMSMVRACAGCAGQLGTWVAPPLGVAVGIAGGAAALAGVPAISNAPPNSPTPTPTDGPTATTPDSPASEGISPGAFQPEPGYQPPPGYQAPPAYQSPPGYQPPAGYQPSAGWQPDPGYQPPPGELPMPGYQSPGQPPTSLPPGSVTTGPNDTSIGRGGGQVVVTMPDGTQVPAQQTGGGGYQAFLPDGNMITGNPDGTSQLQMPDGSTQNFDSHGRPMDPKGRPTEVKPPDVVPSGAQVAGSNPAQPIRVPTTDGGFRVDFPDGTSDIHYPDGSIVHVEPDQVHWHRVHLPTSAQGHPGDPADGYRVSNPNGTTDIHYPDGSIVQESAAHDHWHQIQRPLLDHSGSDAGPDAPRASVHGPRTR